MSGIFITFEGIDGCGKSTQADLLENHLKSIRQDVISVREPGGTDISERIREVLLSTDNRMMSKRTEALLLAASRAQLTLETIVPALESEKVVLCDRYLDSTLAYQGYVVSFPSNGYNRSTARQSHRTLPFMSISRLTRLWHA